MSDSGLVKISAGHGKAARLNAGQKLKLIDTPGTQVVDFWAFQACPQDILPSHGEDGAAPQDCHVLILD